MGTIGVGTGRVEERAAETSAPSVQAAMERATAAIEVMRSALLEAGAEPLRDLIAAMHSKLLIAELRRHRESRG